jgi:hypothetical protein
MPQGTLMADPDNDERSAPEPGSDADEPRDRERLDRHVDEQEEESFPASDPHADWSGPSVCP